LTTVLLGSGLAAAKMNISVSNLSADGQEVHNLNCELSKGGLFASVAVVGTLAKQKAALSACAPDGAAFSVQLTFADGGAKEAKVLASSQKAKEACVARALSHLRTDLEGTCTAIILTGNSAAARKAAKGLAPADSKTPADN
jgi:hypothetical protein